MCSKFKSMKASYNSPSSAISLPVDPLPLGLTTDALSCVAPNVPAVNEVAIQDCPADPPMVDIASSRPRDPALPLSTQRVGPF